MTSLKMYDTVELKTKDFDSSTIKSLLEIAQTILKELKVLDPLRQRKFLTELSQITWHYFNEYERLIKISTKTEETS